MTEAMVTGRMPQAKKDRGAHILQRDGLSASKAINIMFDRIIADDSAAFLLDDSALNNKMSWQAAAQFIDAIPQARTTRFDDMSKAQIKMDRLSKRHSK